MAITFYWSISKLEVIPMMDDKSNVVTNVKLNVVGTDSESNITESYSVLRSFSLGNTFVPYDQLTEQQILDWCFQPEIVEVKNFEGFVLTSTTLNLKQDAEKKVTDQIASKLKQNAFEPALPWS